MNTFSYNSNPLCYVVVVRTGGWPSSWWYQCLTDPALALTPPAQVGEASSSSSSRAGRVRYSSTPGPWPPSSPPMHIALSLSSTLHPQAARYGEHTTGLAYGWGRACNCGVIRREHRLFDLPQGSKLTFMNM
jgi:hypothetical protein